jgi:hypothetical protein
MISRGYSVICVKTLFLLFDVYKAASKGNSLHHHYAPHIYSVLVKFLKENVLVVEEDPGLKETYTGSRCIWVLTDRRVSWASLFGV